MEKTQLMSTAENIDIIKSRIEDILNALWTSNFPNTDNMVFNITMMNNNTENYKKAIENLNRLKSLINKYETAEDLNNDVSFKVKRISHHVREYVEQSAYLAQWDDMFTSVLTNFPDKFGLASLREFCHASADQAIKECEVMFEKKSTIIGKEFETDGSITMFYSLGDMLLNDLYRANGSVKTICDFCHIQKDVTDKIFGS